SDVASNLATTLRGDGFIAVAGGGELGLIPSGRTVTTDVDAATTMPAAGTAPTNTETLTGPAHQNDIWTLRFDTTNTAYTFLADVTSADTIASTIAGAVPAVGGYVVFASGSTIYITKVVGGTLTSQVTIARDPNADRADVSGTPHLSWTQNVTLKPAGSAQVHAGDKWTLPVSDGTQTVTATTTATTGQTLDDIVSALVGHLSAFGATASVSGDVVLKSTGGASLTIGPVTQDRPTAQVFDPTNPSTS